MIERFSRGQIATIKLDLVTAGAGTTGASPTVAIQRKDGKWFQASDHTWQTSEISNAMTETSQASLPGRYHFNFDQTKDDAVNSTDYVVKLKNSTTYLEYQDISFAPLSAAVAPNLCSIQGTVVGMDGVAVRNALVRATLIPVALDPQNRGIESTRVLSTYTNASGDFQLPLVRTTTVRLEIEAIGYDRKLTVPDQASADFVVL